MNTINKAVGIRDGKTILPNADDDMALVIARLNRIPLLDGGRKETPIGLSGALGRTVLIAELAAAIAAFQTVQIAKGKLKAKRADGTVDLGGKTIALLSELAGPDPVVPKITRHDPMQVQVDPKAPGSKVPAAAPHSVSGGGPLQLEWVSSTTTRMIIHVPGQDVSWFGVVIPEKVVANPAGAMPCVFFTPKPGQAGILPGNYNRFMGTAWEDLWERYTRKIGGQLAASGANVILVFPFYTDNQMTNLGSFAADWEDVLELVISTAIDRINPLALRDRFDIGSIMTASFSNGIIAHQTFVTTGRGVASALYQAIIFDARHLSGWQPKGAVHYLNTKAKSGLNPQGGDWFVGGRFHPYLAAATPELDYFDKVRGINIVNNHNRCPMLALHAFATYAPQ
jgi:hypothetical protein